MASQAKPRPHPVGIPEPGTYVTDQRELFRIEAIHRHKGIVLENARSLALFMLTTKEFLDSGYKEIS